MKARLCWHLRGWHLRRCHLYVAVLLLGGSAFSQNKSVVLKAARMFDGHEMPLATLEVGKLADVIAMPGDPAQNILQTEKVIFVMKDGVVYRNDAAPHR